MSVEPLFGVLAFLSFAASVVAAVLAIDMFAVSRTGQFGPAWRVLIIASVMFALVQALRIAAFFDWSALQRYGLSQIVELVFALSLAYAFFLQRHVFSAGARLRREKKDEEEDASTGLGIPAETDEDRILRNGRDGNDPDEDEDGQAEAPRSWPRMK